MWPKSGEEWTEQGYDEPKDDKSDEVANDDKEEEERDHDTDPQTEGLETQQYGKPFGYTWDWYGNGEAVNRGWQDNGWQDSAPSKEVDLVECEAKVKREVAAAEPAVELGEKELELQNILNGAVPFPRSGSIGSKFRRASSVDEEWKEIKASYTALYIPISHS